MGKISGRGTHPRSRVEEAVRVPADDQVEVGHAGGDGLVHLQPGVAERDEDVHAGGLQPLRLGPDRLHLGQELDFVRVGNLLFMERK